jgi:hypothetical protein
MDSSYILESTEDVSPAGHSGRVDGRTGVAVRARRHEVGGRTSASVVFTG